MKLNTKKAVGHRPRADRAVRQTQGERRFHIRRTVTAARTGSLVVEDTPDQQTATQLVKQDGEEAARRWIS